MIIPIILIVIGFVFLAYNYNALDNQFISQLWRFWPVVLILLGVSIVGRKFLPKWLSVIIIIVVIIATIFGAYYFSKDSIGLNFGKLSKNQNDNLKIDEPLSVDISKMNLEVALGAQSIEIDSLESGLITGNITSGGAVPEISVKQTGNTTDVKIFQKWTFKNWRFWDKEESESQLSITNQIPVSIDFKVGASKIDADLHDIILSNLTLKTGAFDGTIKLGNRSANTYIDIGSGASNIKFYIPKSSGLCVKQSAGLVSVKYSEIDMKSIDGEKEKRSSTFNESTSKIYVELRAGASNFEFIGY